MNKNTFFVGQPVFSQILSLISKADVQKSAKTFSSDRYCKKFKTSDHLVVMLYAIFSRCTSIREVITGVMACHSKLLHLGLRYTIRRSTLSDSNSRRSCDVFEDIYKRLYARHHRFLPDSRSNKFRGKLYIIDSTTISLFQEVLKAAGRNPINGKRKGGIKAHALINVDEDVPKMVCFTPSAANDVSFMKKVSVSKGSILVFDKAYRDYSQLQRWDSEGVYWVTRLITSAVVEHLYDKSVTPFQQKHGVISDSVICLGHNHHDKITKVQCRLVRFFDKESNRTFDFLTNNLEYSPLTIGSLYKQRWSIEILFKRLKQNYPLRNFLGDSENAIKIQIWCALIADLLLKVIQNRARKRWSFANLASMIRLHLMNYIHLIKFLDRPERTLLKAIEKIQQVIAPKLFVT